VEELCEGAPIWIHVRGESPIEAIVLKDFGPVVLTKKLKNGRFRIVKTHKSNISARIKVDPEKTI